MSYPMAEGLVDFMIDCRAAGPEDVPISGDAVADLVSELLRLARTCDDLLDRADDWKAMAEARAAQVTYLSHLVEHQGRILAYLRSEVDDPDAVAVGIEAENLILFSEDTLRAIACADNAWVPDQDGPATG